MAGERRAAARAPCGPERGWGLRRASPLLGSLQRAGGAPAAPTSPSLRRRASRQDPSNTVQSVGGTATDTGGIALILPTPRCRFSSCGSQGARGIR